MLKHWKALTATAGGVTAILGVLIAWQQVGFPTPAWSTDIQVVQRKLETLERFNQDTRALLLNQSWDRVFQQIEQLKYRQRIEPDNPDLQARLAILQGQKRQIDQQLEALNK